MKNTINLIFNSTNIKMFRFPKSCFVKISNLVDDKPSMEAQLYRINLKSPKSYTCIYAIYRKHKPKFSF